ncbi:MAG: phosphate ABC transporter ATP-binding protein, partial [Pseudanabaena sp.]
MNLSNSISENQAILKVEDVNVFYSSNSPAVAGVNLEIAKNQITAFIGPSGCGKSTILRCFNRLNDLIEGAKVRGKITFNGHNLYDPKIDPVAVRRHIGMVFQRPNPFPKSIYENIAFGPRINGFKGSKNDMADLVEKSL